MTMNDLYQALNEELRERFPAVSEWDYACVIDVDLDNSAVIFYSNGKTWNMAFSEGADGDIVLEGGATEVEARTSYVPVQMSAFSASFSPDGEDIVYEGEIFRAGTYPDKATIATPADLINLASSFQRCAMKVQHVDTAFDQVLMGYGLERVEARDGGKWLWGRVKLPRWIKDALGSAFKVSVGLALDGGKPVAIRELSIVDVPRVATAKLVAAFAGARNNKDDQKAIQQMHDLAISLGASCPEPSTTMAGAARPTTQPNAAARPAIGGRMNPLEKILSFFRGKPEVMQEVGLSEADLAAIAPGQTPGQTPAQATTSTDFSAALSAHESRFKAMEAQLAASQALALGTRAAEFADNAIRAHKAVPAEREELKGLFVMAAQADANGSALFSAAGELVEGANLKLLKASIEKRQALPMFGGPQLSDKPADLAPEKKARVKAATDAGSIEAYNRR